MNTVKKGFTLIELMIALSIIGILSMILVPKLGATKIEAKNKAIEANIYFIQAYVQSRGAKDINIINSYLTQHSNDITGAINRIITDINSNKNVYFKDNNEITNPFTYSNSILTNNLALDSSVVFKTVSNPSISPTLINKNNTSDFPNNTSLKGKVIVCIYKDCYALYGVNYYGEKINPLIIKMNPSTISTKLTHLNTNIPEKPIITHDNFDTDGNYTITMNMTKGINGNEWRLYENNTLIYTKSLTTNGTQPQTDSFNISGKSIGTYNYKAVLINNAGSSISNDLQVIVENVSNINIPGTPILSDDNWDDNGDYTITMNMWWGNNGTTWKLYENNRLIYTNSLTTNTPYAQTASVQITGKLTGVYTYKCELINEFGSSFSDDLQITVSLNYRGDWKSNTYYSLSDTVTYRGQKYSCSKAHLSRGYSKPPNKTYWTLQE